MVFLPPAGSYMKIKLLSESEFFGQQFPPSKGESRPWLTPQGMGHYVVMYVSGEN